MQILGFGRARSARWGRLGTLVVVAIVGATVVWAMLRPNASAQPPSVAQLQTSEVAAFGLTPKLFPSPSPTPLPVTVVSSNPPAHPAPVAAKPPAKPPAKPAVVVSSKQQALINQDRARYHLAPLTWSSCLSSVARFEASKLATPGVTFQHYDGVSRDLTCHLGRQVGENIGWWSGGISDTQLNTMFMNSPDHKANILGPYRYVATAWAVRSDGTAFITVEFG